MSINVRLLRKVKKHILEEPKRLEMALWILKQKDIENVENFITVNFPKCGTIGCLAGWTTLLGDKNFNKDSGDSVSVKAMELISNMSYQDLVHQNISLHDDIHHLFFVESWPLKLRGKYYSAVGAIGAMGSYKQKQAEVLAEVIEDFISKHKPKRSKKSEDKTPRI